MNLQNISHQRIDRLRYLKDEFMKRPLRVYTKSGYKKQTYSGISDTHHSLLRLLLLLGESPTTDEGMIFKEDCQEVSQQKYLSRDEYYQRIEDEAQKGESAVEWVN